MHRIIEFNKKFNDVDEQFDTNEVHLNKLKEKYAELNEELNRSKTIFIEQTSNSFIDEISIRFPSISKFSSATMSTSNSWLFQSIL